MQCLEEIEIYGYVGGDVKTPMASKPNFVTFSVGVQRKVKEYDVSTSKTTWYQCVTSNEKLAELIKKSITSKSKVSIRGRPKLDAYMDKNNQAQARITINIERLNILRYGSGNGDDTGVAVTPMGVNMNTVLDDEIPF